jgi:5-methylcytosine-specific restriction endonuclease McrA
LAAKFREDHPMAASEALRASVLVLNRLYMVVHVVGARRAFGLLVNEVAEVIHDEDGAFANYSFDAWREMSELRVDLKQPGDDWIKAVNFEIQVPRVIRLLHYDRLPRRAVRLSRQAIFARDGHRCQYCGRRFSPGQLSLDHVIPRSLGGMSTWENMVCACIRCNVRKGGKTPREARMTLCAKPSHPKWNPLMAAKLTNPKYRSWAVWLGEPPWEGATSSNQAAVGESLDAGSLKTA